MLGANKATLRNLPVIVVWHWQACQSQQSPGASRQGLELRSRGFYSQCSLLNSRIFPHDTFFPLNSLKRQKLTQGSAQHLYTSFLLSATRRQRVEWPCQAWCQGQLRMNRLMSESKREVTSSGSKRRRRWLSLSPPHGQKTTTTATSTH